MTTITTRCYLYGCPRVVFCSFDTVRYNRWRHLTAYIADNEHLNTAMPSAARASERRLYDGNYFIFIAM